MNSNIISIFLGLSFIFSSSVYSAGTLPGSPATKTMSPLASERFNSNKAQQSKQTTGSGTSLYQIGQGGGTSLYQGNQNSTSLYSGVRTAPITTSAAPKGTSAKY